MPLTTALAEARVARFVVDRLTPNVYRRRMPLTIEAWDAPGEPVPFAEAVRQDYRPFAVGTPWSRAWGTTWFHVTGTVPDVRPYVAHSAVCVAPLRIARGIQNKVLEAMSMAQTIVVSPQALEGIAGQPGIDLLLAADESQFEQAVCKALGAPDPGMGARARATVEARYSWESNLAPVVALLQPSHGTDSKRSQA